MHIIKTGVYTAVIWWEGLIYARACPDYSNSLRGSEGEHPPGMWKVVSSWRSALWGHIYCCRTRRLVKKGHGIALGFICRYLSSTSIFAFTYMRISRPIPFITKPISIHWLCFYIHYSTPSNVSNNSVYWLLNCLKTNVYLWIHCPCSCIKQTSGYIILEK